MGKKKSKKQQISEKYGGVTVFQWSGYADEPKEKPLVDILETIGKDLSIAPSFLYTIAIGEGLGLTYMDGDLHSTHYTGGAGKEILRTDLEIDGFQVLGVDDFGTEYNRYKKFLPDDFNKGPLTTDLAGQRHLTVGDHEFGTYPTTNERGETVYPGFFRNFEASLRGFAATVAHRKSIFHRDATALKYSTPSEDQQAYWIYVYYQGETRAKRYLNANGGHDFNKKASSNMGQIRRLALERLATWRYIQALKLFSN